MRRIVAASLSALALAACQDGPTQPVVVVDPPQFAVEQGSNKAGVPWREDSLANTASVMWDMVGGRLFVLDVHTSRRNGVKTAWLWYRDCDQSQSHCLDRGSGSIPANDVRASGLGMLWIKTNTNENPKFTHRVGNGGIVEVVWHKLSGPPSHRHYHHWGEQGTLVGNHADSYRDASAVGTVVNLAIPETAIGYLSQVSAHWMYKSP
jgi:hypothetical protein